MLNFDGRWRFETPGAIPVTVVHKFSEFISRVAAQGDRWQILEHFKVYFAGAAGQTSTGSSSLSWADSDLTRYMHDAAENCLLFVEAFYDGCNSLRDQHPAFSAPDFALINKVLRDNDVGLEIRLPDLVFLTPQQAIIAAPHVPSLDEQAQDLIQRSLKESERLLAEGRNRPAVAEILWLLETVSTAFRGVDTGVGTVQEKYFNKIVWILRKHHKGQMLDQVLDWVQTLHGYLSSPTGGGIRHGQDIRSAVEMQPGEATLYCNLIRSYINFLMLEHARLSPVAGWPF
jgi:hypothetical protein